MTITVKNMENTKITAAISMGYRGYTIGLHCCPQTYSFCFILDPNSEIVGNLRFGCDLSGINRAQRVIDALVD